MYRTDHHLSSCIFHLSSSLAEYDSALDPDFDAGMEELERQFDELRLQLANFE
jgi:hypothetical protein